MLEFQKGDEVKFQLDPYSMITYYGVVAVVRERSCTVIVDCNGEKERITVSKKLLNFD